MAIEKTSPAPKQPYHTGEMPEHDDIVRVRADHLNLFDKARRERLKDRHGYIRGFSYQSGMPIVMFEAQGRRKPLLLENISLYHFEFVSRKV